MTGAKNKRWHFPLHCKQTESFLLDFHTVSMTCWTVSWGKNDLIGLMALTVCIHELRTKLMKLFSEDKTPAWEHSREVGVLLQNHLFAVSCVVQNSEHAWRFFCHRNWCQWIRNIGWGQLHRKTLIWEFVIPHSRKSKACGVLATLAINLWRSLESNGNRTATMSRYFSSQSLRHWENWSRWAL